MPSNGRPLEEEAINNVFLMSSSPLTRGSSKCTKGASLSILGTTQEEGIRVWTGLNWLGIK
jgi:hypothetical protein